MFLEPAHFPNIISASKSQWALALARCVLFVWSSRLFLQTALHFHELGSPLSATAFCADFLFLILELFRTASFLGRQVVSWFSTPVRVTKVNSLLGIEHRTWAEEFLRRLWRSAARGTEPERWNYEKNDVCRSLFWVRKLTRRSGVFGVGALSKDGFASKFRSELRRACPCLCSCLVVTLILADSFAFSRTGKAPLSVTGFCADFLTSFWGSLEQTVFLEGSR